MHRPPIKTCFKLHAPTNQLEKLKSRMHHAMNARKSFPNCISNSIMVYLPNIPIL